MKYQLVIFDLDGTILNTLEDLTDSVNYALKKNGYPERSIEEVRSFVGNGIAKLMERAVPSGTASEKVDLALADFKQYYGQHCADKTKPYDGIEELIKKLRDSGRMTAVVSNKADFAVQTLCEQYFPGMFDFVVGEKATVRKKPAPDSVLAVLEHLKVEKECAVYVGDSEVDIQTAHNAGIDDIGVAWGYRGGEFLLEHDAKSVVELPCEILEMV